jgi:hypothetical protein
MEIAKIPTPETRARSKRAVQELRLMDDTFMRECLRNNEPAVQLILRIIMDKPNLVVQKMETQRAAISLTGRGVRFDVWARDDDAVYNIEVEKSDEGASARRARYYSAMLLLQNRI